MTALLTLTGSVLPACSAPSKTVGQEADSGAGSGSASGTGNSGTETSAPETSGTDSSVSGSSQGETDSVEPENCETLDNASDCVAQGCAWQTTDLVTSDGVTCDVADGDGYCSDPATGETGAGCGGVTCEADGNEYWTRERTDGTWEVVGGDCSLTVPDDFSRCEYAGDDPAACSCACAGTGASLPSGFETTLGASGCADMIVFGASPDGSIGLALTTGFEPVAEAVAAGETIVTMHDVSELARLSVYVGTNVTYPECNDALDPDAYTINQEWLATAGTVEIEIVPDPDPVPFDTQATATVTITGLEVTFAGVTESVGSVTFESVAVGWLPG